MRLLIVGAAVLLSACSAERDAPDQPVQNELITVDPEDRAGVPLTEPPANVPEATRNAGDSAAVRTDAAEAARTVKRYFDLLADKEFVEAHKLWTVGVGDLADGTFADQFSAYREYRGVVGSPGKIEGAAGSSFVTVPVQVSGVTTAGERFEEPQVVTLRRTNNVPGATAEQRQWRITRVDKPPH